MMPNNTYDIMKWVAQYLLPALATLYFALSGLWGFPYPDQIVGTIMAIDAFLGLLLGISAAKFDKMQPISVKEIPINAYKIEVKKFSIFIQMSSQTYDILVWITQYLLPGLGTLTFAISGIWNFDYGQQIVGTIAAVDAFLGVILGISTSQYKEKIDSKQFISYQDTSVE